LNLRPTGVAAGPDGDASEKSPLPFRPGESVQIKGRGYDTMHVDFRPSEVDWLIVVAYEYRVNSVVHTEFLIRTRDLIRLACDFQRKFKKRAHPVQYWKRDDWIRLEWWELFVTDGDKTGKVRGSPDTWEARRRRSLRVLRKMYLWKKDRFLPVPDGFVF
jgi:hypothetical protein